MPYDNFADAWLVSALMTPQHEWDARHGYDPLDDPYDYYDPYDLYGAYEYDDPYDDPQYDAAELAYWDEMFEELEREEREKNDRTAELYRLQDRLEKRRAA